MNKDLIIHELNQEIKNLFETKYNHVQNQLNETISTVVTTAKEQFDLWYQRYELQEITKEELIWLIKTQQQIIVLKTLQGKGISKIKQKIILDEVIDLLTQILIKYITQLR